MKTKIFVYLSPIFNVRLGTTILLHWIEANKQPLVTIGHNKSILFYIGTLTIYTVAYYEILLYSENLNIK